MRICFSLVLLLLAVMTSRADDWPQWLGPERDGIWREGGIIKKFPESGLNMKWRVPVDAGYSGPAVADGRVYLTDRQQKAPGSGDPFQRGLIPGNERVVCLDAANGKVLWQHEY